MQNKPRARIIPTKEVLILGLNERELEKLVWCAVASGMTRLFWLEGYLLCLEVFEKSFDYEIERGFLPVSQVCYARFPKYAQIYKVSGGHELPIIDVSDLTIYRAILDAIRRRQG